MGVLERWQDGSCVVLQMNRPDKRNALDTELLEELTGSITDLSGDPQVRGVVLTGSDEYFSSGVDLDQATRIDSAERFATAWRGWADLTTAIERSPLPVIAAINGYALTGGLETALCCDYRIAGTNALFGITSAKIGSVAGMGGTQRLPRLIGRSKAKRLLFTGEFISAAAALRIGLVDEVVEIADTVRVAVELVREISSCAPLSVALQKQAVNAGMEMDLNSALDFEKSLCAYAFTTEDRLEGMTAFLEKRKPSFRRR